MEISQLRSGDSGDAVAHLHSLLELHGIEVSTEELNRQLFGPSTRVAVKEFQKANGIRPTAQVGQRAADLLATPPVASMDPDATITPPAPSLDGENVSPALESTSTPSVPAIPTPPTTSKNQPDPTGATAAVDPNPPNPTATLLDNRIATLTAVLTDKKHQQAVDAAMRTANGDISVALNSLKPKLPDASLQKITFAHSLADLAIDRVSVVKAIVTEPGITNLRDVALRFNIGKLAGIVDANNLPADISAEKAIEEKQKIAVAFRQKLFVAEPTAVLQRMVLDAEIPIADATISKGVANFLNNQPDFNIRTTSIYTALKHPEAFKDIAEEHRAGVVENLKTIQRVQSLSPIPEAVPILINANLTSAFGVAELPESSFLRAHGEALGEETALQVYTTAINSRIRNEQALRTIQETLEPGLAIMGASHPRATLMANAQAVLARQETPVPLNLEALFGDMDFCECEECTSVYSPAAYFVELLQYLRNNNLDPTKKDGDPTKINPDATKISGTPLEKLFRL